MWADVQKCPDCAPKVANDDWRSKQFPRNKVTIIGKVTQTAHHLPRGPKQQIKFLLILLRTKVQRWLQDMRKSGLVNIHLKYFSGIRDSTIRMNRCPL